MKNLIFTILLATFAVFTMNAQQVSGAEYFWGADPGAGNGNPMFAFDGDFDNAVKTIVNNAIDVPSEGIHTLSIRALDEENNWGPLFTVVVNVSAPLSAVREIKVTAAEYYFNNDPGPGNGTPMLAVNGDFSEAIEALKGGDIPAPIQEGIHVLWMRARDAENNWGPSFGVVVNMDTTITGFNAEISGPVTLCSGDEQLNVAYQASATPGATYLWTVTNGNIISGQGTANLSVDWETDGPHLLHLEKCLGDVCEEEELFITIHPSYETEDELTICFGDEVMLGGAMQNEPGVYTDVLESIAGCDSTVHTTLMVLPEIELSIEASDVEICNGDEITLTASGADDVSWSDGIQNGVPFVPEQTTSYTVTGTTDGCSSESSVEVIVNPLPEVSIMGDLPELVCLFHAPIELTFGSPAGGIWSGNGVINNLFNPEVAGVDIHLLTYTFSDENDCSNEASFEIQVDFCTSVGELEDSGSFVLFPNPSTDICWIETKGLPAAIDYIAVHDAMGRVVGMKNHPEGSGALQPGQGSRVSLDVGALASGTYVVRLVCGDIQLHKHLVIAR
ncbi:MAG: T9SS C-terminal target domain-containing protein [Cryomorphaceae bacterium]|nr:MAG: T9SS C-terminal target domain-containing protein [Cryomorphaceae bacterium]